MTVLAIPQFRTRGLPTQRREGSAEIVILPCIRRERIGEGEGHRAEGPRA